jgi:Protein of unknown function (DUF664)
VLVPARTGGRYRSRTVGRMAIERPSTPLNADERVTLEAFLDYHRATLLWKCEGLSDHQLRTRAMPPSNLSLLGLVRHLTEIERGWFRQDFGDPLPEVYCTPQRPEADFEDVDTANVAQNIAAYKTEVLAAKATVANLPLDYTITPKTKTYSLRWIYLHMLEEYARHNGHADLLRQGIDGRTGE